MSLQETVNHIVNDKREKRINQIQKRLEEMSDKWWSEQWEKTYEIMEYYYRKTDEQARHKIVALKMERMEEIYRGYQQILQQAKNDITFDMFHALENLKKQVATYDDELEKWRKKLHRYEGSEKYDLRK